MNICIITKGFPTPKQPEPFTFLDQLACAWADTGHTVFVICPVPAFVELFDKKRFYKAKWMRETRKGNKVNVFCPRFFSASDKVILGKDTEPISYKSFQEAVMRVLKDMKEKPDVLYGHFLPSGCQAGDVGQMLDIPAFCAFGESSLWSITGRDVDRVKNSLNKLLGIVSVSTENKRVLIDNGLFREEDIEVFPNGVDHSLFLRRNKQEIRRKMGFPEEAFIGAYIGSFTEDKGVLRAQKAAVEAGNVEMIYIGGGKFTPKGSNILFCGKLQHELIPEYLNTADFFILPTKAEGCCNAIIEAMACGLPIISAKGAYNDDILSDEYALRTNPEDVNAMSLAITNLKNNETRGKMSVAAEKASFKFDIEKRACLIVDFMKKKVEGH